MGDSDQLSAVVKCMQPVGTLPTGTQFSLALFSPGHAAASYAVIDSPAFSLSCELMPNSIVFRLAEYEKYLVCNS